MHLRPNRPLKLAKVVRNPNGQLSIFLGISLLIVITLMGFIVNVGLFVKAKINLQNSVDAAAFAGAAVQARQLTNIGYLNWEMRNNYKEWMYKYYVLGQLGLPKLRTQADDEPLSHFRLKPFNEELTLNPDSFDRYNLPTICIQFGSESNVCEIYQIPGLPRFDNVDIPFPGIVETQKAFLNEIIAEKSRDCSTRSALNQGTATIWAYGTQNNAFSSVPIVAGNRPGAWISSLEMAIRMRNLEAVVNRPPVPEPICISGSGCRTVNQLSQEPASNLPMNERPVKAFMSAYRNLGGGAEKEPDSQNRSTFAQSLKLTEISPRPQVIPQERLSTFLIPPDGELPGGVSATTKTYLDLQAIPLNLVSFFTTMVSTSDDAQVATDTTLTAEGECAGTRTALPVPGFIFGFIKNPQVLTYYAVKGEADFVGLFYPFRDRAGVKLQAYAAAKPFGGRIGPRLFDLRDNSMVMARADDSRQFRSGPYISGIEVPNEAFERGLPIPVSRDFWVTDPSQPIGGIPTAADSRPRFTVPNLLYDYQNFSQLDAQGVNEESTQGIQILGQATTKAESRDNSTQESLGLYEARQYNMLRDTTDLSAIINSSTITAEDVERAIIRSRMPTKLEALNYMIPHIDQQFSSSSDENLEQPASIVALESSPLFPNEDIYRYELYAPLSGPGTLYPTGVTAITTTIREYLSANENAIDLFIDSLENVAESMRSQSVGGDGLTQADYSDAADVIHRASDLVDPATGCTGDNEQISMAGQFHVFFKIDSNSDICGVPSLPNSVATYINNASANNDRYDTHYRIEYAANPDLTNSQLMTGFMPGPRQGADNEARLLNPFTARTDDLIARRNIYSTKFVSMASLTDGECNSEPFSYCYSYLEQPATGSGPSDFTQQEQVKNYVRTEDLEEFFPLQF